ncbi:phosphatase PAP2 family protein [Hymenobacter metallicola]|uniref:Phosphatase PAP2 family protein n=1 Tax=Hymenobacter metallicola TaxID=2563114 RepID=A0A4Z0Q1K4_9BACT|nr:phosphatase PAP2 family protein [Hymenobacter metallicola]TGE22632.1 phosphatase PAP2 family protein [Hymenobacter metallicola]
MRRTIGGLPLFFLLASGHWGLAQVPYRVALTDSVPAASLPQRQVASGKPWYQGRLAQAGMVPAALIGYGISTINGRGLYSSYDAREEIGEHLGGFRTRADDFLQFAPYLELGVAALAGARTRDDRLNTLLLIGKAEAIMLASVYALKYTTNIERPNGAPHAFPSGHTAQAFVAATLVHLELRDQSPWYGVGAYTIATSVAALRMINNKHWQSDVVTGAGIGILSAQLASLSHRYRWGRRPLLGAGTSLSPSFSGGAPGLSFTWRAQ